MLAVLSLITMMLISGNVRRGVYVVVVALVIAITGLWLAISAMRGQESGSSEILAIRCKPMRLRRVPSGSAASFFSRSQSLPAT